jgi:hypothetical protein
MALGWENVSVAKTNGGVDVFGLAGFLRDDDLISHDGLVWKHQFGSASGDITLRVPNFRLWVDKFGRLNEAR